MAEYDIIVVGGGISGLSMAHFCARDGRRVLLIEQGARLGGCIHSHLFTTGEDAFWTELGAHTCFNSYASLLDIMEERGLLAQVQGREKLSYKMCVGSALKSIPSQLHLPELLLHLPRLFTTGKAGKTVAEYYGAIVGPRNYREVFSPAFRAVICQPADDVPAEMLFRKRPRRKDVPRSFTFAGGLQTLMDAIVRHPGIDCRTATTASGIAYDGNAFCLTTTDGQSFEAGVLAIATPAAAAARLLSAFPEITVPLSRIREASIETLGIAVQREKIELPPIAGIIAREDCFYSAVSRDVFPHPDFRGFTFHFRPGVLDEDGKLERACSVLGITPQTVAFSATKTNWLPAPRAGHDRLVQAIDRGLAGRPLLLTGNYFSGVSLEDCVSRSRSEYARLGWQSASHQDAPK